MRRGPFFVAAATSIAIPALGAATRAMSEGPLTHLAVLHLGDSLATRTALTPHTFEAHPGLRRTNVADGAVIAESLGYVKAAHAHRAGAAPDIRWGLVYSDDAGARRQSIYLDKFGKRAIIDGQVVALDGAALVGWLRARFGG